MDPAKYGNLQTVSASPSEVLSMTRAVVKPALLLPSATASLCLCLLMPSPPQASFAGPKVYKVRAGVAVHVTTHRKDKLMLPYLFPPQFMLGPGI